MLFQHRRQLFVLEFVPEATQQAGLSDSGLDAGNLVLELTEGTFMHHTAANLDRLHELKTLAVRLAIDDFGIGYSSLAYLHRFPIDVLKIDRCWSAGSWPDGEGPELARAVVMLGETLGLETIAEGIESDKQAAALIALGRSQSRGVRGPAFRGGGRRQHSERQCCLHRALR